MCPGTIRLECEKSALSSEDSAKSRQARTKAEEEQNGNQIPSKKRSLSRKTNGQKIPRLGKERERRHHEPSTDRTVCRRTIYTGRGPERNPAALWPSCPQGSPESRALSR